MADRLTDKDEKISGFTEADISHLVDTDDTTQNSSGSSYYARYTNILSELGARKILGCLVVKWNVAPDNIQIQSDDWVLWMDITAGRLIIGIALDDVTSIPTDLDDILKFKKFHEGTPLI